jgi:hypothetical protein
MQTNNSNTDTRKTAEEMGFVLFSDKKPNHNQSIIYWFGGEKKGIYDADNNKVIGSVKLPKYWKPAEHPETKKEVVNPEPNTADSSTPTPEKKFKKFWVKSVNNWICDADYNGKILKERNPFPSFRKFWFIKSEDDLIGFTKREGFTNMQICETLLNGIDKETEDAYASMFDNSPTEPAEHPEAQKEVEKEDNEMRRAYQVADQQDWESKTGSYTPKADVSIEVGEFTKGEWYVEDGIFVRCGKVPVLNTGIANFLSYEENRANALRITQAVNAHDGMRSFIEQVSEMNAGTAIGTIIKKAKALLNNIK